MKNILIGIAVLLAGISSASTNVYSYNSAYVSTNEVESLGSYVSLFGGAYYIEDTVGNDYSDEWVTGIKFGDMQNDHLAFELEISTTKFSGGQVVNLETYQTQTVESEIVTITPPQPQKPGRGKGHGYGWHRRNPPVPSYDVTTYTTNTVTATNAVGEVYNSIRLTPVMVNAVYNLTTLDSRIVPYVYVGAGAAFVDIKLNGRGNSDVCAMGQGGVGVKYNINDRVYVGLNGNYSHVFLDSHDDYSGLRGLVDITFMY